MCRWLGTVRYINDNISPRIKTMPIIILLRVDVLVKSGNKKIIIIIMEFQTQNIPSVM